MQGAVVTPLAPAQNVSRVHASSVERPPETTSEARTLIITMFTVKKRFADFPSPAGMSLAKLYPAMESLVRDIPAGDEKTANLFLQCTPPCVDVNIYSDMELLAFLTMQNVILYIFL